MALEDGLHKRKTIFWLPSIAAWLVIATGSAGADDETVKDNSNSWTPPTAPDCAKYKSTSVPSARPVDNRLNDTGGGGSSAGAGGNSTRQGQQGGAVDALLVDAAQAHEARHLKKEKVLLGKVLKIDPGNSVANFRLSHIEENQVKSVLAKYNLNDLEARSDDPAVGAKVKTLKERIDLSQPIKAITDDVFKSKITTPSEYQLRSKVKKPHRSIIGSVFMLGVSGTVTAGDGYVQQIFPKSLAAQAGLRVGDQIRLVNGRQYSAETMQARCRGVPGTPIYFTLADGREVTVTRVDFREFLPRDQYYQSLIFSPELYLRAWFSKTGLY